MFKLSGTVQKKSLSFYPADTPCRIDVDSTWILCRYIEDQISTNFHVVSTYFFRCNFDGQQIHVVSANIFRCNFDGGKIHVISRYCFDVISLTEKSASFPRTFFWCNFDGGKISVVSTYFFWCNFDGRQIHLVSANVFRCNFDGGKIQVVSTYFFDVISLIEKSTSFPCTFSM